MDKIDIRKTDLSSFINDFFQPFYSNHNGYSYIKYNDIVPNEIKENRISPLKKKSYGYGKAKGLLAWKDIGSGKKEGIWFAHRFDKILPKFGNQFQFEQSRLEQPNNGAEGVQEILKYLLFVNVNSYEKNIEVIDEEIYKRAEKSKIGKKDGNAIFTSETFSGKTFEIKAKKENLDFKGNIAKCLKKEFYPLSLKTQVIVGKHTLKI